MADFDPWRPLVALPRRSAVGQKVPFRRPRPNGGCRNRKRSVAFDDLTKEAFEAGSEHWRGDIGIVEIVIDAIIKTNYSHSNLCRRALWSAPPVEERK